MLHRILVDHPRETSLHSAQQTPHSPRVRGLCWIALLTVVALLSLTFALAPHSVFAATITVDGTTCTLDEAITSANNDTAGGNGCTSGSGVDTLILSVGSYHLTSQLPAITSTVVMSGGIAGATVA